MSEISNLFKILRRVGSGPVIFEFGEDFKKAIEAEAAKLPPPTKPAKRVVFSAGAYHPYRATIYE